MKNIIIILGILSICACKDDYDYDFSNGKATFVMDGNQVTAEAVAGLGEKFMGVTILIRGSSGRLTGTVELNAIPYPPIKGTYFLQKSGDTAIYTSKFYGSDDDVLEAVYDLKVDSLRSIIEIEGFNENTGFVTGTFQAIYYKSPSSPINKRYADSITITQGHFEARSKY